MRNGGIKVLFGKSKRVQLALTAINVGGVILTGYLSAKCATKAQGVVDKYERKKERKLTKFESGVAKTYAYAPAIAAGLVTVGSVVASYILNAKTQSTLVGAYAVLERYFASYREEVVETVGEETEKDISNRAIRSCASFHEISVSEPDKKMMFYEPVSKQHFLAYEREVSDAEYHINRNYVLRGYVLFNEWLEFLGLQPISEGDVIGWGVTDDWDYQWIDFEHTTDDISGEVVISYLFWPEAKYVCEWIG